MNIRMRLGVSITLTGMCIVASCNDDVTAPATPITPTVGSIVLELESDTLSVKQTTQLHATVLSVDGDILAGEAVTFESSNENIATISDTGLVTAMGPGRATITARAGDRAAAITIFVRKVHVREVGSVLLLPDSLTVAVGETAQLTVILRDKTGAVIAWSPTTKGDPDIVFFCGIPGQGPVQSVIPGRFNCWVNEQLFGTITSGGLVRVYTRNVGPEPVFAQSQGVNSNTIWLSTR